MRGPRRTASPVRLTLNTPLGGDIDGAWWPHTSSIASELPELIDILHTPLGEVVDININWSATSGAPLMITQSSAALMKMRWNDSRQRIMVVVGRLASARLLVIPNMTTPQLGMMVMRRAAGMSIPSTEQDSLEYQAADRLVRPLRPRVRPTAPAQADQMPRAGTAFAVPALGWSGVRSDRGHLSRLGTLGTLADLELNALILLERTEAVALDFGVVNEQILLATVRSDEAEALFAVKPFHSSLCHLYFFFH